MIPVVKARNNGKIEHKINMKSSGLSFPRFWGKLKPEQIHYSSVAEEKVTPGLSSRYPIAPLLMPHCSHRFPARLRIAGRISDFQFDGYLL